MYLFVYLFICLFICLFTNLLQTGLESSPNRIKKNSPKPSKPSKPLKPAIKQYKEVPNETNTATEEQTASIGSQSILMEDQVSDEDEPFTGKLYDAFANRVEDDFEKDFQGLFTRLLSTINKYKQ